MGSSQLVIASESGMVFYKNKSGNREAFRLNRIPNQHDLVKRLKYARKLLNQLVQRAVSSKDENHITHGNIPSCASTKPQNTQKHPVNTANPDAHAAAITVSSSNQLHDEIHAVSSDSIAPTPFKSNWKSNLRSRYPAAVSISASAPRTVTTLNPATLTQ
mmetsp:Transcript_2102/g.3713  ORF Transcript_2102/g.3713 Transcript_2102/m.3713 type:complete len:160 (-) Transcript_2102:540-1019(-)